MRPVRVLATAIRADPRRAKGPREAEEEAGERGHY